jgi:hypothetical protein
MSVDYCHKHHLDLDLDFTEGCYICQDEEYEEENKVRTNNN